MYTSAEELTAVVDLRLAAHDRTFRLPGTGSPSLLYVFDGQQIGARAVTLDGSDLMPNSTHEGVALTFWADEARVLVVPGQTFMVWYGGDVGEGTVRSVGWQQGV